MTRARPLLADRGRWGRAATDPKRTFYNSW